MTELASALIGAFVALMGILLAGFLEGRREADRRRLETADKLRAERKSAAIGFINDAEIAAHRVRDHARDGEDRPTTSLHEVTDAIRRAQIEIDLIGTVHARGLAGGLYRSVRELRVAAERGVRVGSPEWTEAHDRYVAARDAFTTCVRSELGGEPTPVT